MMTFAFFLMAQAVTDATPARPNPPTPVVLRGHWVELPNPCEAADPAVHLHISNMRIIIGGETDAGVLAITGKPPRYILNLDNRHQDLRWETTTTFSLSQRGQRLSTAIIEQDGQPASGDVVNYRRCP
jgi:hypothetical protein